MRLQAKVFGLQHQRFKRDDLKASFIKTRCQKFGLVGVLFATQADRDRQVQFQLRTAGKVIDGLQIYLRGDLRFREVFEIELQVTHALIAQRHRTVDRVHFDAQLRVALTVDFAVQH